MIAALVVLTLLFHSFAIPPSDSGAVLQIARFSVILEGGTVYNGGGLEPFEADIGIIADTIAAIGNLGRIPADVRIDVRGLAVAPGFIDIHSHGVSASFENSGVVQRPLAENYLRQGVTTIFGGQDGSSPYPVGPFLSRLDAAPAAINVGLFVGHNTIRSSVMGNAGRKPSPEEMTRMQHKVRRAMEDGAFGLSTGLEYTPGAFAETEEIVELAREAAPFGGIHVSHIRDEGGRLLESVRETIRVGEEAGIGTQVTHHKVIGSQRWGMSRESLRLIDEARERGVDASSDVYPYTASSTGLTILFPRWALEGSRNAFVARLREPESRARIHAEVVRHLEEERGEDPASVVAAHCSWDPSLNGLSLADMLEREGRAVTLEAAAEKAIELQLSGGCQGVFHSMSEEDMIRILRHPFTMVSSDGGIPEPGAGVPHPRSYGTFARVLGRYARDEQVLDLQTAIHKMTGLPAWRAGLERRGRILDGYFADITVFDPEAVRDHATFTDPHRYSEGVVHVYVNGRPVLLDGVPTGERPGRALRHRRP